MALPQQYERYTWQDYLSWPEGDRWELIQGVAYAMSPAPTTGHQRIVVELSRQFSNYLLGKPCEVLVAPFDLKLSSAEDDEAPTVVQPDLAVTCRRETVTEQGITGAPDLCVEVTSPGSVAADRKRKFDLYEKHGVPEYWIVESSGGILEVYRLDESGRYARAGAWGPGETVSPAALPDLVIDLSLVFRDYSARE
ncbi:MAG: Uma2 family endonuclease [Spirochaetaceae bacterium]|nr:MAG: Uma2 family endonuclease [Spirochaetaceae bacterium]TVR66917.1 MAG: Uma2 family endonuclease [Spirochaetaceae bacterium]